MLASLLEDGSATRRAVFEVFSRRLPEGRRFGVCAGLGRLVDLIADFRFADDDLRWLADQQVVDHDTLTLLESYRFSGDIDAFPEGELYFPYSPVCTVSGTLADTIVLETLVLSVMNFDSAVASAAARMSIAAGARPLIEMGSRRTHEDAAVAAARATYLAGFASTSNLAAGRDHGIPTTGTAAHAYVLAHPDERSAFTAQIRKYGTNTTLLVDTYDIEEGIRTAIEVAGPELAFIRIDSGDLAVESRKARMLLDSLGAHKTGILITSDLDEYIIAALADSPIDGYGVGTRVVTGSGHPTASMVYKLVEIERPSGSMVAVAKRAAGKASPGGRKFAFRRYDGPVATAEVLGFTEQGPDGTRPIQVPVARGGQFVDRPTLAESRTFHLSARDQLSDAARSIADGGPALVACTHQETQ